MILIGVLKKRNVEGIDNMQTKPCRKGCWSSYIIQVQGNGIENILMLFYWGAQSRKPLLPPKKNALIYFLSKDREFASLLVQRASEDDKFNWLPALVPGSVFRNGVFSQPTFGKFAFSIRRLVWSTAALDKNIFSQCPQLLLNIFSYLVCIFLQVLTLHIVSRVSCE